MNRQRSTLGHGPTAASSARRCSLLPTHSLTPHFLTYRFTPHFLTGRGQASLEMAIAMGGVILLLLGSLKVYAWVNERLISRQQYYEATRVVAGSAAPGAAPVWDDSASHVRLDLFPGD